MGLDKKGNIMSIENQHRFEAYRSLMPNDWDQFCQIIQKPLPQTFWLNPQRSNPQKLIESFEKSNSALWNIPWIEGAFRLLGQNDQSIEHKTKDKNDRLGRRFEYKTGQIHLQEEVSMLPVLALNPQPNDKVLDLCAAPGGKTAQISLMMQGQGTVIANDKSFGRLRALRSTQERLGLFNLALSAQDGQLLWPKYTEVFDKILADVPCSCEGTIRKAGSLDYEEDETNYRQFLQSTQKKLLLQALQLVKVGGTVVYSTCTFDPNENEAILSHAFSKYGDAIELMPMHFPGLKYESGLKNWQGKAFEGDLQNAIRIYPQHNDTGGFFIACIKKNKALAQHLSLITPTNNDFSLVPSDTMPRILDASQKQELIQKLKKRYAIDQSTLWDQFEYYQNTSRYISAISANHGVLNGNLEASGVPIVNLAGHTIQLTSAAAMAFSKDIHQQYVMLENEEQVDLYYQGKTIMLSKNQKVGGTGTTVVKYGEYGLGMATVKLVDHQVELISNYPKASQLAQGASAFEKIISY